MLYLIPLLSFIVVFLLVIGLHRLLLGEQFAVVQRLLQLGEHTRRTEVDDELSQPFFQRVIKPFLESLAKASAKFTPAEKSEDLQKKLIRAGNPGNLAPGEFAALQLAIGAGLALLGGVLVWLAGKGVLFLLGALVGGMVLGKILTDFYLQQKARARQEEMEKTLPDVLDLLCVSVEAGLGFDGAVAKVVEKMEGSLVEEFARVLLEAQMGKPRREALRDMAARTRSEDLITLIGSIVQADQLGVSIGNVLRLQSDQMRSKRRQRAEEQAMKAPIKMLFPLIIFIFPTLFIILLGPAVIQIMEAFK